MYLDVLIRGELGELKRADLVIVEGFGQKLIDRNLNRPDEVDREHVRSIRAVFEAAVERGRQHYREI